MNDHKPIIEKIDFDNLMRFESFTEMEKYLNEKLLGQFESMKIIVGSQLAEDLDEVKKLFLYDDELVFVISPEWT